LTKISFRCKSDKTKSIVGEPKCFAPRWFCRSCIQSNFLAPWPSNSSNGYVRPMTTRLPAITPQPTQHWKP
jgi:hypothetical protein